jgi:hypothetical protein
MMSLIRPQASLEEAVKFAFENLGAAVASFERIHGKRYSRNEEYLDDEEFFNFVYSELDGVVSWASTEELADWTFGSIQEAKHEFKRRNSSA